MDVVQFDDALISGKPKQLVFLTGLDAVNNPGHNFVHQLFSNFVDDRFPVQFRTLNGEADLSPSKKDSFAIKGPRGILKSTWVRKYTERKPAVVVVFTDLDWDHPSWIEKKTECESKISSLRQSFGEQSATRFALVLLQSRPSEDLSASEKISEICTQCRITQKQLFTLSLANPEVTKTAVVRNVQAFHEMCQQFYQTTIRSVRARAIPNNYPNLLIRQQFKLAFLSELRMDTHTALRHYRQAYNQITTYEIVDCDAYEIRSIAGLLNYKICQLSFAHSTALEALSQYRKFITTFYAETICQYPSPQLASIELSLWRAKQSVWFAELFENAIGRGLVGISTQHPGLHYHAAANFYIEANKKISNLRLNSDPSLTYPQPDPFVIIDDPLKKTMLYYGQRPWRVPFENGNLADPVTERNGRVALELKSMPNYPRVMNLLNLSLSNYRTYRCERFQRQVLFQMADEYLLIREPGTALNLLTRVMWELRRSNLRNLLHPVLLGVLSASYCIGSLKDYMTALVQLMNPKLYENVAMLPDSTLPEAYASFFAQNFLEICDGRSIPQPIQSLSEMLTADEIANYEAEWNRLLAEPNTFHVNMNGLDSFVSISASFLVSQGFVPAGKAVVMQAALHNKTGSPIPINQLGLKIGKLTHVKDNNPDSTEADFALEFAGEQFLLEPKKVTTKVFTFVPKTEHVGVELIIKTISLEIARSATTGNLDWEAPFPRISSESSHPLGQDVVAIIPTEANVVVKTDNENPKSLLGEISGLTFEVINEEETLISNIRVECTEEVPEGREVRNGVPSIRFLTSDNKLGADFVHELQLLESGESAQLPVHYSCSATGNLKIKLKVKYDLQGAERTKNAVFEVASEQPFLLRPSILTINCEPVSWLINGQESILRAEVEAAAPLTIRSIKWTLNKELWPLSEIEEPFEEGCGNMETGEVLSPCVIVKTRTSITSPVCELGQLVITWNRPSTGSTIEASVRSVLDLGTSAVENVPIVVTSFVAESPCVVRSPIPIVFTLKNTSTDVLDLRLTLDLSDVFMFAGHKEISVRLLPGDSYDSKFTLLALSAGRLPFPRLVIECPQAPIDKKSFASVPASLYVLLRASCNPRSPAPTIIISQMTSPDWTLRHLD
ncbi:hypothetical protein L596_018475 [Steinernema carpocapsae]|uniref:Trafficking protein particle complex subunit 11 domain-containing protein n=1 Tax=Steinernema carpocapsae TaxID=34508 RepID=A0A4U5N509_STECR|nr:hypothetical protein L596_018475 [Steinernema carpocapsae]